MADTALAILPLTPEERTELTVCEAKIREGLTTFYEVGSALKTIDERKLYREVTQTFEEYCQVVWGFSGSHGYRQIAAKEAIDDISPLGDKLLHEKTVRPLTLLHDPLEKQIAVQLAYATAAKVVPSGRVTEAVMQTAVQTVQEIIATQGRVDMGDGSMPAATASVIVKYNERVKAAIEEAETKRGEKTGQVVIVLKRKAARLISRNGRQVTFEFESEVELDKLPFQENGVKLELSLNKKYTGQKEKK